MDFHRNCYKKVIKYPKKIVKSWPEPPERIVWKVTSLNLKCQKSWKLNGTPCISGFCTLRVTWCSQKPYSKSKHFSDWNFEFKSWNLYLWHKLCVMSPNFHFLKISWFTFWLLETRECVNFRNFEIKSKINVSGILLFWIFLQIFYSCQPDISRPFLQIVWRVAQMSRL